MANGKVSHAIVVLVLLASTSGVPLSPFAPGLMGLFGGGVGGIGGVMGNNMVGARFSGGAQGNMNMPIAMDPSRLSAVTRRVDKDKRIRGLVATITENDMNKGMNNLLMGGYAGGLGGYGGLEGGLVGYGGLGGYGRLGGYGGLGGGYGGLGGSYGGLGGYGGYGGQGGIGGGSMQSTKLDLNLEVSLGFRAAPLEVLLVFTSAANPDTCTPESLGSVLTGAPMNQGIGMNNMHGFGYAGHNMMSPANGAESQFGVISTLTVQSGINTYQISGLGDFTMLSDLAGRGIALCEDVVMGLNGPMCAGDKFQVLFCGQLGYSVDTPVLQPVPK